MARDWQGVTAYEAAIAKAEARGHFMANDPPHSLSSMSRHTCEKCGRSVLGNAATAYGSALEVDCGAVADSGLGYMQGRR